MNELEKNFRICLDADYTEGENAASWCVKREDNILYILFEHSHGTTDWMNNLKFHAVPYREMHPEWQCHQGFLTVWKSAKQSVIQELMKEMQAGTPEKIKVIGYSHGAAISVLCYEWIWYRVPTLREKLQGFGYGCPRVIYGKLPLKIALRWNHFYVVRNGGDIVTHLPPGGFGYSHVGNLIELPAKQGVGVIDAHRPEEYLQSLQKLGENYKLRN